MRILILALCAAVGTAQLRGGGPDDDRQRELVVNAAGVYCRDSTGVARCSEATGGTIACQEFDGTTSTALTCNCDSTCADLEATSITCASTLDPLDSITTDREGTCTDTGTDVTCTYPCLDSPRIHCGVAVCDASGEIACQEVSAAGISTNITCDCESGCPYDDATKITCTDTSAEVIETSAETTGCTATAADPTSISCDYDCPVLKFVCPDECVDESTNCAVFSTNYPDAERVDSFACSCAKPNCTDGTVCQDCSPRIECRDTNLPTDANAEPDIVSSYPTNCASDGTDTICPLQETCVPLPAFICGACDIETNTGTGALCGADSYYQCDCAKCPEDEVQQGGDLVITCNDVLVDGGFTFLDGYDCTDRTDNGDGTSSCTVTKDAVGTCVAQPSSSPSAEPTEFPSIASSEPPSGSSCAEVCDATSFRDSTATCCDGKTCEKTSLGRGEFSYVCEGGGTEPTGTPPTDPCATNTCPGTTRQTCDKDCCNWDKDADTCEPKT